MIHERKVLAVLRVTLPWRVRPPCPDGPTSTVMHAEFGCLNGRCGVATGDVQRVEIPQSRTREPYPTSELPPPYGFAGHHQVTPDKQGERALQRPACQNGETWLAVKLVLSTVSGHVIRQTVGKSETTPPAHCITGPMLRCMENGADVAGAKLKSKPGDDFFGYANGVWLSGRVFR